MQKAANRRRFVQYFSLAGFTLIAACSDKPAPTPEPAPAPVAPPPPAPEPAPAPAAAPMAEPASAAEPAAPAAPATSAKMPLVDAKDPQALALGYVSDAAQADKTKYKNFVAGSHCANCALFQGQASDTEGGCPLFPGKHVAAKGWCSAWTKKA